MPTKRVREDVSNSIIDPFRRTARRVCDVAGGPLRFLATRPGSSELGLENAHRNLRISPAEFDEVAAELARTLEYFKVPDQEKKVVLEAFAAHKDEVTEGYREAVKP